MVIIITCTEGLSSPVPYLLKNTHHGRVNNNNSVRWTRRRDRKSASSLFPLGNLNGFRA